VAEAEAATFKVTERKATTGVGESESKRELNHVKCDLISCCTGWIR